METTNTQDTPGTDPHDLLLKQTQIMDSILHTLITREVENKFSRYYGDERSMEWMSVILRLQKQCADTVKTISAIEYMNMLNNRTELPPPPKHDKQNE